MNESITVRIKTPVGFKKLSFEAPNKELLEKGVELCEDLCPLSVVCEVIRNPRKPDNVDSSFMNLCCELGVKDGRDKKLMEYIPSPGTIDTVLNILFEYKNKKN